MLAAHIPRVPLKMTIKNVAGIQRTLILALVFANRTTCDVVLLTLERIRIKEIANIAGNPSRTNCGKEWESGNREKTLKDS